MILHSDRATAIERRAFVAPSYLVAFNVFAAIVLSGCIHLAQDPDYEGPAARPDALVRSFAYQKAPGEYCATVLKTKRRYTLRRISFDSSANVVAKHPIVVDYYDIQGTDKTPVIVVLPILGGSNTFADLFASYFANRDYAALVVHRQPQFKGADKLEEMNPVFKQIVLDHKQVLDWITTQPDLAPEKIGLFGISPGAIKGSLVSALDDRVKASVLALVGGDVPHIFSYSDQGGIAKRRKQILREHGITAAELYQTLKDEFVQDPLNYARHIDARNTLLILGMFDAVVPYKNGQRLRDAIGGPSTILLPTGHYGALAFLPYIQHAALSFFRDRFDEP